MDFIGYYIFCLDLTLNLACNDECMGNWTFCLRNYKREKMIFIGHSATLLKIFKGAGIYVPYSYT